MLTKGFWSPHASGDRKFIDSCYGDLGDCTRVEVVGKWMFVNTQFWNKEFDVGTL
jgi:hypothetical protein